MVSVHHNLEAARQLDSLTIHGSAANRIDVGGTRLDNGLRPHLKANDGGFHRVIRCFVSVAR